MLGDARRAETACGCQRTQGKAISLEIDRRQMKGRWKKDRLTYRRHGGNMLHESGMQIVAVKEGTLGPNEIMTMGQIPFFFCFPEITEVFDNL
jgi:hypothetical protein